LLVVSHAFSLPLYLPIAVHSGISAKKRAVDQFAPDKKSGPAA
jgi:hypothetical protein